MQIRRLALSTLCSATLLAGCASGYGGRISGDDEALSPEERRLQQAEGKIAELSRRLDAVNLTGMDQENIRLRDDIRSLRGEMERLRYDFDQQQKRAREQYLDLDRRLQRFEAPLGIAPTSQAPAAGIAQTDSPGTLVTVQPPAAPPAAAAPPAGTTPNPPISTAGVAPPTVTISQGNASPEEEGAYLAAFDLLKNGKYDDAVRGFRSMIEKWPQGRYADNAWYWMGEANYVKRDYKSALNSFQSLLQRFPTSPKAPDAMLKVGLTQIELKQDAEGRETLQRVTQSYPNSNAAKLAQQRLAPPRTGG